MNGKMMGFRIEMKAFGKKRMQVKERVDVKDVMNEDLPSVRVEDSFNLTNRFYNKYPFIE